jgi:hypothetical protein
MITEETNKLILDIPKFKCDNALGDIPKPLPSQNFFMCFVGKPRSGKTSTAISLISQKKNKKKQTQSIYRGVFDNIIVVCPKTSLSSLKKNVFKDLDDDKIFYDLDLDNLTEIYDKIKGYRDNDEQTLLYIDDMASSLKDTSLLKLFNKLICNRRHLKVSCMFITQYLNSIPLSNRKLISHIFLWKCNNKKEYINIYEELMPMDKDVFEQVVKYSFQEPHDFLFMDVDNAIFYKNFNKLIISS